MWMARIFSPRTGAQATLLRLERVRQPQFLSRECVARVDVLNGPSVYSQWRSYAA